MVPTGAAAAARESADASPTRKRAAPIRTPGARILFVDDNADMRDYVSGLLHEQGWIVDTAADGETALSALQEEMPDLVLADIMMPKLDGFGLMKSLRADSRTRDVPVFLSRPAPASRQPARAVARAQMTTS